MSSEKIDLRDFDSWDGSGNNDSSAALQSALTQALAAKGGTIVVPSGITVISSEILAVGGTSNGLKIVIEGLGTNSQVKFAGGISDDLLSIQNVELLLIKDILFRGAYYSGQAGPVECNTAINLNGIDIASFVGCKILAINSNDAIVKSDGCGLIFDNNRFGGGTAAQTSGIVDAKNWNLFRWVGNITTNYGNFDGNLPNFPWYKNYNLPGAWVRLERDNGTSMDGIAHFADSHFDDGPLRALWCEDRTGGVIRGVTLDNVTSYKAVIGASGVVALFKKVNHVASRLGTTWISWLGEGGGNPAIYDFQECGEVLVEAFEARNFDDGFGTFTADSACGTVRFIENTLPDGSYKSSAAVTIVQEGGVARLLRIADDNIAASTLVKWSDDNDGHVKQHLAADTIAPSGVALETCAKATGTITCPAPAGIPEGGLFRIRDGFGSALIEFWYTKNSTNYDSGPNPYIRTIDITAAVSSDDVAAATATAINDAQAEPIIGVTAAAAVGAVVTITNDLLGEEGNQGIQNGIGGAFTTTGMSGGAKILRSSEQSGNVITVLSDGSGVLAPNDPWTWSTTVNGYCRKATSGKLVLGIVQTNVPATLGAPMTGSWAPQGYLP